MAVQRGLSRDINSNPYAFADAGAYTPKPPSFQDAISNISAKYTMPNVPSSYVSAPTKSEPTVSFADAIAAVNAKARGESRIPKGASAYSFRHARISELLQDYGIDPLTVAHQTGTSVRMIEQHYHRFIAPALREKLAQIDSK